MTTTAELKTNFGTMTLELYEEQVPNTVKNFLHLSQTGFYNGITFHRIIKDFMIQGGCPQGFGTGGPGYKFADEIDPELKHTDPGTLSMANAGPNTNGSQFFITLEATPWLDGKHAVFGKIIDGQDVLVTIGDLPTGMMDRPDETVLIEEVKVYRDGQEIEEEVGKPEVL